MGTYHLEHLQVGNGELLVILLVTDAAWYTSGRQRWPIDELESHPGHLILHNLVPMKAGAPL